MALSKEQRKEVEDLIRNALPEAAPNRKWHRGMAGWFLRHFGPGMIPFLGLTLGFSATLATAAGFVAAEIRSNELIRQAGLEVDKLLAGATQDFEAQSLGSQSEITAHLYPPIGSIIAWHPVLDRARPLPAGWVRCDGQVLDNDSSHSVGWQTPDLNGHQYLPEAGWSKNAPLGVGLFLRGGTQSGVFEDDDTQSHLHQKVISGSSAESGSETLPKHMSVVWIIRVK